MKLRTIAAAILTFNLLLTVSATVDAKKKEKWVKLFDGQTFAGWKVSEPEKNSWKIENGAFEPYVLKGC